MSAGYSKRPLSQKLGIKPNFKIFLASNPEDYLEKLAPIPKGVVFAENIAGGNFDFIHFFTKDQADFKTQFPALKKSIKKNGMIWISWPKKASKVVTDVDESVVRLTGLENGLVDVKICAVDEVWSGLKFVYRLKDR